MIVSRLNETLTQIMFQILPGFEMLNVVCIFSDCLSVLLNSGNFISSLAFNLNIHVIYIKD